VAGLPTLALVGPGRAGRALARSWLLGGGSIASVSGRSDTEREDGGAIPGEVLVLAVPDDRIASVAARVASRTAATVAFHLSGALPGDAIAALRAPARPVGSLHPLRAFTGAEGESLAGALVAVEGDAAACDAGMWLVEAMGARGRRIEREAKTLYHAGATLAAGGAVALLSRASRVWALAGIPEEEARPALAELAASAIAGAKAGSFEEALTGPIARRDLATVRAHVDALAASPDLLQLYAALALEVVARTPGRGHEDALRALLERPARC
jgi:predicted short-subunit dehydrogenase-like oxidoreductase (DUF2520 family)